MWGINILHRDNFSKIGHLATEEKKAFNSIIVQVVWEKEIKYNDLQNVKDECN